jgi:hypothetical protein
VGLRHLRPAQRARCACAAIGIATFVAAGAARSQEPTPADLGLKGVDEPEAPFAPPAPGSEGTNDGQPGEAPPKPKTVTGKTALPPLKPYKGAERLDQRGGPAGPKDGENPSPTVAALPTPPPPKRPVRDDRPFDPLGVSVGDLRLKPFVEEDLGWSSNPGLLPGPQKGSGFLMSEAGFTLDSDWSQSAVHGDFKGGLTDYFADPSADAPFANGVVNGRWDLTRALSIDGEGRLAVTTMTAGSLGLAPNVAFGASGAPVTETYGATVGGDQNFGRFDLSLHGSIDRTAYEDATLSNGAVDELSSDDFSDWGLRGRAAYRLSAAFRPFLDVLVDTRRYDSGVDQYGYQRNSDGVAARIGAEIDLAGILTGSVDVGYGERDYQDPRLPNLASPLFDASLVWAATGLTTVTLKTVSSLAETTIRGASGAAQHATTLEIDHALRRYLTLTGAVGYATDAYAGLPLRDTTTTFTLVASYSLNRDMVLKASVSRQFYVSNQPGTSYAATVVMMGLKLQR